MCASCVRIEPAGALFPETYVQTVSRSLVNVYNNSMKTVHFRWSRHGRKIDEDRAIAKCDKESPGDRQKMNEHTYYTSKDFSFNPPSFTLGARQNRQVIVSFSPSESIESSDVCYLVAEEVNERHRFVMKGKGIPPFADFSVRTINIGHVALESVFEYKVDFVNHGDVAVTWTLVPKTVPGLEFRFSPECGTVQPRESVPIHILFVANQVKPVNETFTFLMQNSPNWSPTLTFTGRVVGPVFSTSVDRIDFGRVSSGTVNRRTFYLENKSKIGFDYTLMLTRDGNFASREFNVNPSGGSLEAFSKQLIEVEFIPTRERHVNAGLHLNINKFGTKLLTLPLVAEIVAPSITAEPSDVDIGIAFIEGESQCVFRLRNDMDIVANFEFVPPNDDTQLQADVIPYRATGAVPPMATLEFPVTVIPKVLGQLGVNCALRMVGTGDLLPLCISGVSSGPALEFSQSRIAFGKINVLNETEKVLNVTNTGPIPAPFRNTIECSSDVFKIEPVSGVIAPHETVSLTITAYLDDTKTFNGTLIFRCENLNPTSIPIQATGLGVPIVSSIPMEEIPLGPVLTEHVFVKEFAIMNKGARRCTVMMFPSRPKLTGCTPEQFSFRIEPPKGELEPEQVQVFALKLQGKKPSSFDVSFQCHATIGSQRVVMYTPKVFGSFIKPKLSFSVPSVMFKHLHDKVKEEKLTAHKRSDTQIEPSPELLPKQAYKLFVTNQNPVEVHTEASIPPPFSVSMENFVLGPGEAQEFEIIFDPSFKKDFISEEIIKKLVFTHGSHSIKFTLSVTAHVLFPNIVFQPSGQIDFGLLLMNTERTQEIKMINGNEIGTEWDWELLGVEGQSRDVTKIFDIYPIRGRMNPGETDAFHVQFLALGDEQGHGLQHAAKAICHVHGGPDYILDITGSSSNVDFRIEPSRLELGSCHFQGTVSQKVTVTNLSDAPISFKSLVPKACSFESIVLTPVEGKIRPNESVSVNVAIKPGSPRNFKERLIMLMANVQEFEIPVIINASFEQVELPLPRHELDPALIAFNESVKQAKISHAKNPQIQIPEYSEDLIRQIERKLYCNFLQEPKPFMPAMLKRTKKKEEEVYKFKGFVLARYNFDLGVIVLGEKMTKDLNVKNAAQFPLSGTVVDIPLEGSGFSFVRNSITQLKPGETGILSIAFDTEARGNEVIGEVAFEVPFVFSDDLGIMLHIHAVIETPALSLSQDLFDFSSVVVGQYLTMVVQVQNMTTVMCDYQFGAPVLIGDGDPVGTDVIAISSTSGNLPPQYFQNIELTFSPMEEKKYHIEIPIKTKYSREPLILTVRGIGVKLGLVFDPPIASFKSMIPFSDPVTMDVTMINKSSYPIEVFSYQFDFLNYADKRLKEEGLPTIQREFLQDDSSDFQNSVTKLSVCVIVHGVNLSGRSTVSKIVSEHLGGIPIVNLKDVWKSVLEKEEVQDADFVSVFSDLICEPDFINGFVIDGLDVFDEVEESEPFLAHCMKQRNVQEEIARNPLTVFNHSKLTACEQALAYVLAGLDGHYVFMIALKTNRDIILDRIDAREEENIRMKKEEKRQKKEKLKAMSEEQYELLDQEEQEKADRKRKAMRDRIIQAAQEALEQEQELQKKQSRSNRPVDPKVPKVSAVKDPKSPKAIVKPKETKVTPRDQKKEPRQSSPNSQRTPRRLTDEDRKADGRKKERTKTKYGLPVDPVAQSIIYFNFTLGSIAQRLLDGRDCFQVVDPVVVLRERTASSMRYLASPDTGSFSEGDSQDHYQSMNSLVLNTSGSIEDVKKRILAFIPSIKIMKEKVFTRMIPRAKSGITDFTFPRKQKVDVRPTHFRIVTEDLLKELELDVSVPASTRRTGRTSRKYKHRNEQGGHQIPFLHELNLSEFTPRWRIDPESSRVITIEFCGKFVGDYKDSLNFGVTSSKMDLFRLPVSGSCSYPDIERDVEAIFTNVARRFRPDTEFAWVTNLNAFHCGYLLTKPASGKADRGGSAKGQLQPYRFPVKLMNNSQFVASVTTSFTDNLFKAWTIEPAAININPGETVEANVSVHPNAPELLRTTLQLFIRDNPEPIFLPLMAEATSPLVDVTPSTLDFERMMLRSERTIELHLKNNGKIPFYWVLKHLNSLGPGITFAETEGTVQPKGEGIIPVVFSSPKPIVIKKGFQVDIWDANRTKAFFSQQIQVLAEAYDTHFDVIYPKGMNHLMYGQLRVGQSKQLSISFKNKSKYPVRYAITIQGNQASQYLRIESPNGIVSPGEKPHNVSIVFQCAKVISLSEKKVMTLKVTDTVTGAVTNTFPLSVSAQTFHSQFEVNPPNGIDFGAVPIQKQVSESVTIKNTGMFPFDYEIISKREQETTVSKAKRGRAAPRSRSVSRRTSSAGTKGKPRKSIGTVATIGPFSVCPSTGTIQPNQETTISVDFQAAVAQLHEIAAMIRIIDGNAGQTDGIDFPLKGKTFAPEISTDFEQVFRGQMFCLRCELKQHDNNAFLEDENTFYFAPLLLRSSSSVQVTLVNPLPIPCTVDISVKPKAKGAAPNFPFDVSEKSVNLDAMGEKAIDLKFSPLVCDTFYGCFEAVVRGNTSPDSKALRFWVEGTGTLPTIMVATPLDKPRLTAYSIPVGRVILNSYKEKTIAIKNDSFIPAKIKVTRKAMSDWKLKNAHEFEDVITLEPDRIINICGIFSPTKIQRATMEVTVAVLDNPKSTIVLTFAGEGYTEDVVFDGGIEDDYDIIFKDNVVGRQQQASFIMRNISKSMVRFQWPAHHDFTFSPKVGHLRPDAAKKIIVTFFTEKPVKYPSLKINCQWSKIELQNPDDEDWDDSMKTVAYIPKYEADKLQQAEQEKQQSPLSRSPGKQSPSRARSLLRAKEVQAAAQPLDMTLVKVVKVKPEPAYRLLPAKMKDLVLRVYAISDVIKFTIDTTEVNFSPTMMYQRRTVEIKVTNTCQIKFDYQWIFEKVGSLHQNVKPPFTVEPSSGHVPAGKSRVFKLHFSPEEVDDFTAVYKFVVPFLSVMKPTFVSVAGISRRPLCHFDVELSDYLSAGRRNPAFTDPLPDGVRVIEIFAKGVGTKTIKRFDLINPTSAPYEIRCVRVEKGTAPAIQCLVPQALVSGGKRYSIGFTYTPTSVKTVESLWLFTIQEHNLKFHFLVVGKIMPS